MSSRAVDNSTDLDFLKNLVIPGGNNEVLFSKMPVPKTGLSKSRSGQVLTGKF
jgi:hypothetical protein